MRLIRVKHQLVRESEPVLLDIVVQSVTEFQADCLKICEKHYPTIHNQGMKEHHLGMAFARRLARTLTEFEHNCQYHPIEITLTNELPHHFRISSDIGTVWVITHHMTSAGETCRKKLFKAVHCWKEEYGYAIQPYDLLILVNDHWISRTAKSRELIHWWMGELPDDLEQYNAQGITLYESDSQFAYTIEHQFGITPCYSKYGHPLKNSKQQQLVRKYIQLFAVLQWS